MRLFNFVAPELVIMAVESRVSLVAESEFESVSLVECFDQSVSFSTHGCASTITVT